MKSRILTTKTFLLAAVVFSLFVFLLAFGLSYRQDQKNFSEAGRLTSAHLTYALDLKDDMAVIDWSKNLEGFEDVLAFQVRVGGKVAAQGGNRDFIPQISPVGTSFQLPSVWVFHLNTSKDQNNPRDFIILFKTSPGPFFWGLFGFLAAFLSTAFALGLIKRVSPEETDSILPPETGFQKVSSKVIESSGPASKGAKGSFLFLDKHFVIRQISPEAAGLLKKNPDSLIGGHLFDLAPEPSLMAALENGSEVKVLNPFSSQSGLSVTLQSDPQGTLLFLKPIEETETPKKH